MSADQVNQEVNDRHYIYNIPENNRSRMVREKPLYQLLQRVVMYAEASDSQTAKGKFSKMHSETLTPTRNLSAEAGFTLLELMVAMVLTGLLVLLLFTSLSLCLKAMGRGQAASEVLQELRVGQRILTRSLASAFPGSIGTRLYFQGDPRQIRFFTSVPLEAHSLGGIYHWRVFVGEDEAGRGVLTVEQTKNVNWRRDPEGVESRQIIISDLSSVHFSYGRGQESQEIWDTKTEGRLPDWVEVSLTPKGRQPMVLLIPIHMAETDNDQSPHYSESQSRQ